MAKHTLIIIALGVLVLALTVGILPAAAQSEGRIAGIVYADKNGNGIRDQGEEGVIGAQLTIESGGWKTTIDSKADGSFSINLNPATYRITIAPPSGYNSPQNATVEVTIANAGDAITNLEFGITPEGTVLPASGGIVSGSVVVVGLIGVLAVGVVLVVVGQRRSKASPA